MGAFKRAWGMTFTCPAVEKTERPVPSRLPENGSKIIPSRRGTEPPSVVGTRIALPFALRIGAPSILLKFPVRKSAVGTEESSELFTRSNVPSQSVKKKSLFFWMGPPMLAPSMLRTPLGLFFTPARFSSQRKARRALLSWPAKALPRNELVPALVTTVTAAPPVMPCSASKLLVEM